MRRADELITRAIRKTEHGADGKFVSSGGGEGHIDEGGGHVTSDSGKKYNIRPVGTRGFEVHQDDVKAKGAGPPRLGQTHQDGETDVTAYHQNGLTTRGHATHEDAIQAMVDNHEGKGPYKPTLLTRKPGAAKPEVLAKTPPISG